MAIPDLVFPRLADEPIDRIWEAVKAILRGDANMQVVRTLKLWEGEVDDASPPTAGEMPWVRVTPMPSKMVIGDEASWLTDLTFKYELAVEGTKLRNLFLLYGAFREAFAYDQATGPDGASTVLRTLQDAGAVVHSFQVAAIGPLRLRDVEPDPMTGIYPIQNLAATGLFSIRVYLSAIQRT
jgi:hypothetical protein